MKGFKSFLTIYTSLLLTLVVGDDDLGKLKSAEGVIEPHIKRSCFQAQLVTLSPTLFVIGR